MQQLSAHLRSTTVLLWMYSGLSTGKVGRCMHLNEYRVFRRLTGRLEIVESTEYMLRGGFLLSFSRNHHITIPTSRARQSDKNMNDASTPWEQC